LPDRRLALLASDGRPHPPRSTGHALIGPAAAAGDPPNWRDPDQGSTSGSHSEPPLGFPVAVASFAPDSRDLPPLPSGAKGLCRWLKGLVVRVLPEMRQICWQDVACQRHPSVAGSWAGHPGHPAGARGAGHAGVAVSGDLRARMQVIAGQNLCGCPPVACPRPAAHPPRPATRDPLPAATTRYPRPAAHPAAAARGPRPAAAARCPRPTACGPRLAARRGSSAAWRPRWGASGDVALWAGLVVNSARGKPRLHSPPNNSNGTLLFLEQQRWDIAVDRC
jgi:hypothetical protein